jgi:large subunit ribosomal protein L4e
MRHSAELSRKRRDYRGSYGFGISRVPRKIMSRRGRRMNWEGAIMPGTVGGRRAHPPKAEKKWAKKINKKERRKAVRSAMAATLDPERVTERGHNTPDTYPFLLDTSFEDIKKTQQLRDALISLDLGDELDRTAEPRKRSGKGKNRGREKTHKVGILVVVSDDQADVINASSNIPGVDAVPYNTINTAHLAPGTHAGRIMLYTEAAIDKIEEDGFAR